MIAQADWRHSLGEGFINSLMDEEIFQADSTGGCEKPLVASSRTDEHCWVTFVNGSSIPQWKIPHKDSTHFFNAFTLSKDILALFFWETPFSYLT